MSNYVLFLDLILRLFLYYHIRYNFTGIIPIISTKIETLNLSEFSPILLLETFSNNFICRWHLITQYLGLCQILLRHILLLDCNSHVTSFLVIKINLLSFPFIENENMFSKDYHNLRKDNIHRRRSWRTWIEVCEKIYCL